MSSNIINKQKVLEMYKYYKVYEKSVLKRKEFCEKYDVNYTRFVNFINIIE